VVQKAFLHLNDKPVKTVVTKDTRFDTVSGGGALTIQLLGISLRMVLMW